jgi:ferrous iron transport protein A
MRFRNRGNFTNRNIQSKEVAPLTNLCEGEKAVVVKASGGSGITRRLAEMGLTPGIEVKLLRKCAFHGPLEVEIRGVTLALGYGVASKVFVKPQKVEANG